MQLAGIQFTWVKTYMLPFFIIVLTSLIFLDYLGYISFKLFGLYFLDTVLSVKSKQQILEDFPFLASVLKPVAITVYIERKVYIIIAIKKSLLIFFYSVDSVVRYLDSMFLSLNSWVHENYQHYWFVVLVNLYGTRSLKIFWLDLWSEPFFQLILFPISVILVTFIGLLIWKFINKKND